ncbi:MAG TPA: biopolymer transporter ExbD [Allosphingosinicella sp.]|nr:biopolymer transporter ExbD [Allosphingosinicella sp.]
MAMQVGESGGDEDTPMSDINTTPLVDVMLVLLIIFLIAVPIVLQSIPVRLPKVRYEVTDTKPENVNLSVREVGGVCEVYWDTTRLNTQELLDRARSYYREQFQALTGRTPEQFGAARLRLTQEQDDRLPEAHIRADIDTPYRCVGGAIFTMQRAGYARIGFISEPTPTGGQRL